MFNFIKKKNLQKLCDQNQRQRRFYNFQEIKSIVVLFETSEYEDIDNFIVQLEKLGKQVSACAYKVKGDIYDYSDVPYRIVEAKIDTNRNGTPHPSLIKEVENIKAEVVMDLTIRENYTLEYILSSLHEPLKIGLKKNDLPLYDFMITKLPEPAQEQQFPARALCKEIIHYLTTIRSTPVQYPQ